MKTASKRRISTVAGVGLGVGAIAAASAQSAANFVPVSGGTYTIDAVGNAVVTDVAGNVTNVANGQFTIVNGQILVNPAAFSVVNGSLISLAALAGAGAAALGFLGGDDDDAAVGTPVVTPTAVITGSVVTSVGDTGNQAAATLISQDVNSLFTVQSGTTITSIAQTSGTLPTGVSFDTATGLLTQTGNSDYEAAGEHVLEFTATADDGTTAVSTVTVSLALKHDFGSTFSDGTTTVVDGSAQDDDLVFNENTGEDGGNLTINTFGGDDRIEFGDRTADSNGQVTVNAGAGNDEVEMGRWAGNLSGQVTINLGEGDDKLTSPDHNTIGHQGTLVIDAGTGADEITLSGDLSSSNSSGDATIDLGDDTDADELSISTFGEDGTTVTIQNFEVGVDHFETEIGGWSYTGTGSGADRVFNNTNYTVTFEDVDPSASTTVSDYIDIVAP